MSILSSFIQNQLLRALEAEFIMHAPDVQNFIVKELSAFATQLMAWAERKLEKQEPEDES